MPTNNTTNDLLTLLGGFATSGSSVQSSLPASTPGSVEQVLPGIASDNGPTTLEDALAQLTTQIVQLRTTAQSQIDTTVDNTKALVDDITAKAQSGGSSVASTIGSVFSGLFGSAFGLSPLISGLVGLFGGGGQTAAPTLVSYTAPSPAQFAGGISGSNPGSVMAVDYNQDGQVRAVPAAASPAPQQITIQVQAMDSQSFLDHSQDIAQAVRQAMLTSNALRDVVGEM